MSVIGRPAHRAARLLAALRDADWLHAERIVAWSLVLLIAEVLFVGFVAAWQHGLIVRFHHPVSSDFVSFYAAGKLALAGMPARAYDHAAHYLVEQQVSVAGAPYQFFFYPPVFLLPCMVLATVPYHLAYAGFEAVTLALFLLAIRPVLGERGWHWVIAVLAFPAVFWTIGLGQNAFLTAALFAGFTALLDRRPVAAGLLLSAVCYKPHFGLLAPVALLAARRWTAFAAATTGVAALVGLSVLVFGWQTWLAYLHTFAGAGGVYTSGRIQFAGMVTPFGAALLLGAGPSVADGVQAIATLAATGLVALIWYRCADAALRSAALVGGTLLAVPLALLYDQMLWLVALAWLVRTARRDGFLPWEKLALAVCYPAILLTWPAASGWQLPLGPLVSAVLLVLVVRRASPLLPIRRTEHGTAQRGAGGVATAT